MFRMDATVRNLVEAEYHTYALRYPGQPRLAIEALILGGLEADGRAMRYLRRNGKTIAWKATPKMRERTTAP
jgi:hypothetical protein